jgi:hypothetical protein
MNFSTLSHVNSSSPAIAAPPTSLGGNTPAAVTAPESSSYSGGTGGIGSLLNTDRNKKRTPARAQKLIGDLYLMAGRLDMGIF